MALTNSQYDAIMREYSAKQAISRRKLDERTSQVYTTMPEYKELLDMGVISQEEFDSKKKQLLGL